MTISFSSEGIIEENRVVILKVQNINKTSELKVLQERLCLSFLRELIERKNRRKMENNILRIFM